MCEICSKLITKTTEQRQSHRSGVFIVKYEQILHIALMFPVFTVLNLNIHQISVSIKDC